MLKSIDSRLTCMLAAQRLKCTFVELAWIYWVSKIALSVCMLFAKSISNKNDHTIIYSNIFYIRVISYSNIYMMYIFYISLCDLSLNSLLAVWAATIVAWNYFTFIIRSINQKHDFTKHCIFNTLNTETLYI